MIAPWGREGIGNAQASRKRDEPVGRRREDDQSQVPGGHVARAWRLREDCCYQGNGSQGPSDSTPGDHPGSAQGLAGVVEGCVYFVKVAPGTAAIGFHTRVWKAPAIE